MKLKNSHKIYKRSKKVLSGPSTFSKGVDQFAYGISPYAIDKSIGAYAWDVDGNRYLDTIMSLGAILIGHNNSKINNSINNSYRQRGMSVQGMSIQEGGGNRNNSRQSPDTRNLWSNKMNTNSNNIDQY